MISDSLRIKGTVEYTAYRHIGDIKVPFLKVVQNNILVNGGKNLIIGLLSEPKTTFHISKMGFGIGNSVPAEGNSDLTNRFTNTLGAQKINDYTIGFYWKLGLAEYNGNTISEFGLFSEGNTMFARVLADTPIIKSNDISINGVWKVTFNAP